MLKTLGIVQACLQPHHPPRNLARRLGGHSLLEWVVRRVSDALRLDGVIVLAGDGMEQHFISSLVPLDIPVFVGQGADALAQFARALENYQAEAVVRVHADNLFVDPLLIDRLVTAAESQPECDYASFCSRDGRPAVLLPVGVYAEWFRSTALWRAARHAKTPADRQQVTRYIYTHPQKFKLKLLPAPHEIDRDDVRLTVDSDEDWDHALAIYEALGPERLDWQRIANLLDHQPALRRRMAALNREYCTG
jgi:spore coat polysaccharide biosynthesis protein SpsF